LGRGKGIHVFKAIGGEDAQAKAIIRNEGSIDMFTSEPPR
jgi:hypothetical protein